MSSFEGNLSGFFRWDLPAVKISPEWVTGPEQGTSSSSFPAKCYNKLMNTVVDLQGQMGVLT
jgi:hypothetical protein